MIIKKVFITYFCVLYLVLASNQLFAIEKIKYSKKEQTWINKNYVVRVRVGAAPPLHFFDGKYRGISVDYMDIIAKKAGFQVQYLTDIPWPVALNNIKNHEGIDLLLTAKITPKRLKEMLFTREYLLMPYVIFSRKDNYSISTIKDLDKKNVSIEKGYAISKKLSDEYPKIILLKKETTHEALQALSLGEANAYIGNLTIGTYILQQQNLTNIKVAAPTPFDNHNQAMAIRDDWPELASIIDKTLNAMQPEDHEAIRSRWLSIRYEYGIQFVDILKWVLVVTLISIIIIAFVLISNKRLKIEITKRKQVEDALRQNENRLRLSMHAAKAGSWIWDIETNEVAWDDRMQNIFGYEAGTFDGTYEGWKKRVHPEDRKEADRQTTEALKNGTDYDFEYRLNFKSKKGEWRTVRAQATVVSNNKGERKRMAGFCEDITERKQEENQIKAALKEKETLLQEIHHRVKNNMQVISSLLKLQSSSIEDDRIKDALKESQNRIYTMSAVHETLHGSGNLSEIDLKGYLSKVATSIFQTYNANPSTVKLNISIEEIPISIKQASPLGLVINEVVSNSLKYAFPEDRKGEINLEMKKLPDALELTIMDNGIGIPGEVDWKNSNTLGLKLVRTLVENQLDGSIDMESNNGTKFTIKFNIET